MIVYKNTAFGFIKDVESNTIADIIERDFEKSFGRSVAPNEKNAWQNSMNYMERVVRNSQISSDCGIMIEYTIPTTSKRIDFLISGHDMEGKENFVIIELKQWSCAESTEFDGTVRTVINRKEIDTTHPSYQAYSYQVFLGEYNEKIFTNNIQPYSCAYLHNYERKNPEPLLSLCYSDIISKSPLFFRNDSEKLQRFIKKYVGEGNGEQILYEIEKGKIRPSKKLINHVNGLLKGNKEFVLLDEQKVAYEKALNIGKLSKSKSVVIIKGGPGTGKSVVSMNLLGELLKSDKNAIFVAPNASFRTVIVEKLKQENKKSNIDYLFRGSAGFVDTEPNTFDVIVVDEAHRLKNHTAYQYYGYNQIDDIIKSSKVSIFFIDEHQMIRPEDIGSIEGIKSIAKKYEAEITEFELVAQYRCSGADGYINWLDNTLHIRETANYDGWEDGNFDFKVFDTPNELSEAINEKILEGENARLVAGYAWPWTSEKNGNPDANILDINIGKYNFTMPWNSRRLGTRWAVADAGINQIGCIHTVQGLEFDYVGVIVGKDLKFDPSTISYVVDWNSYKDSNGKKNLKNEPDELSKLVRNIYKVLMTRGTKGCYVFFEDDNLKRYFLGRLNRTIHYKK